MDWDLWSVPYDPDVIEEDALKEKCCIQVLRILITKADSEIDELEQDLIILQSELAWIENEEWSEISYNALTSKIDSLDTSMRSLRNEDVDDVKVHLLMHTQPVERLHEVLQALLGNYFCKKDLQPANAGLLDSSFHPLKLEAGFSTVGMKSSCPISIQEGKNIKSEFYSKEQALMQNLPTSYADKERQHAEKLKTQPTNPGVDNPISDASQHVDDICNTIEKASTSNSTIASGGFEEQSHTSMAGLISGSPVVIKTDTGEKVKDINFGEDVAAEELKCVNELDESENADIVLCIPSVLDYQEGLSSFSLKGTDEPTMKKPQEGLLDFTSNETDKPTTEGLEIGASEILISRNSSEMEDSKEKNPLQILKVEAALTEKENCALTSLLEQKDIKGSNAMMLQPKEEDETMPEVDETVSNLQDLQKGKNINSKNPLNFHQVGGTMMIVDSITKGSKRQKTSNGENGDEKINSVTSPSKKILSGKTSAKALVNCDSEVQPIPCYSVMEKMRLSELRKVAKAHKLSKYSLLNKKELIQMLAGRNGGK